MKNTPLTVLVVDDEAVIRLFLKVTLEREGYRVVEANDGNNALEIIRDNYFDIVILDLNLGTKINGLRVMEAIRWRWPDSIVIILTGHGTLESAIAAIREGIDAYLLKPVGDREILQTIDDAVKRSNKRTHEGLENEKTEVLEYGAFQLNPAQHTLKIHEQSFQLTPSEFRLMHCLISNPNRVVKIRDLVYAIQQYYPTNDVEARENIKWYIHRLRKKIEPDLLHPRYILNVRGVGYKLVESI